MWCVSDITVVQRLSGVMNKYRYCRGLLGKDADSIFMDLVDYETGKTLQIVHDGHFGFVKSFISRLLEYQPYGWCPADNFVDDTFVVVDEPSYKFLDLVKGVKVVRGGLSSGVAVRKFLASPVDSQMSIFHYDFASQPVVSGAAYTLFHLVGCSECGWYGDKYYMLGHNCIYEVSFNDAVQAHAFIGKYSMFVKNCVVGAYGSFLEG